MVTPSPHFSPSRPPQPQTPTHAPPMQVSLQSGWGGEGSRVDGLTGYPLAWLPPPGATALSIPPAGHIPSSPSTAEFNPFPPLNGLQFACPHACCKRFGASGFLTPTSRPARRCTRLGRASTLSSRTPRGPMGSHGKRGLHFSRNYHAVSQSTGSVPPAGHERVRSPMSRPARGQPGSLLPATLTGAWVPPGAPRSRPSSP